MLIWLICDFAFAFVKKMGHLNSSFICSSQTISTAPKRSFIIVCLFSWWSFYGFYGINHHFSFTTIWGGGISAFFPNTVSSQANFPNHFRSLPLRHLEACWWVPERGKMQTPHKKGRSLIPSKIEKGVFDQRGYDISPPFYHWIFCCLIPSKIEWDRIPTDTKCNHNWSYSHSVNKDEIRYSPMQHFSSYISSWKILIGKSSWPHVGFWLGKCWQVGSLPLPSCNRMWLPFSQQFTKRKTLQGTRKHNSTSGKGTSSTQKCWLGWDIWSFQGRSSWSCVMFIYLRVLEVPIWWADSIFLAWEQIFWLKFCKWLKANPQDPWYGSFAYFWLFFYGKCR